MSDFSRPAGLALAHFWVAFGAFLVAVLLGLYQVLERAELIPVWAEGYYIAVTAHGMIMAYVLTTFFITGFGYYTAASSLRRSVWNVPLAWAGFATMLAGVVLVVVPVLAAEATVLYTFYAPLTAHWTFYAGTLLLLFGSLGWVVNMIVMTVQWQRTNPGEPFPLPMFATTANAILWSWTLVGVGCSVAFMLLPLSLGWVDSIDVGLSRTLFAWTLHPLTCFWLIPAYIAMYTIVPRVAGGRLYSDKMARIAFILLLVFAPPIGMHHLYADPFQTAGWKLLAAFGTFMVAVPTLLTGFAVIASLEIAGRLRGGGGMFGWITALPWKEPVVLAQILALLLLTLGGFGGMVNASYGMNSMVHNTMWVPAHFHLIFAGTVITMYFAIAYHLWPKMTGNGLYSAGLARLQLWLWFIGIAMLTLPWHYLGLLWMPRRTANLPYAPEFVRQWQPWMDLMAVAGVILVISALLFVWNLLQTHSSRQPASERELEFAEPLHPVFRLPKPLNGFTLWNAILLVYMVMGFGYPLLQFFLIEPHNALAWGW
jgi:cytochrome c oxidase subunit 1